MKHPQWKAAAEAHGGKYAGAVQGMHDAIQAAEQTEVGRTAAVFGFVASASGSMAADGSSVEDGFGALKHMLDNEAAIKSGCKHGITE